MKIFDSHVHFVDPNRPEGILWPRADSSIYRRHLPDDLLKASKPATLTGCVAVETSRRPTDDDWLVRLARGSSLIEAVVLNLQPDTRGFESRLEQALTVEKFVGIRLRPIETYNLQSPELLQSFGLLQQEGKTIEFGAKTLVLKESFARLAAQFDETTWILDHCGHPPAGETLSPQWCDGIVEIAAVPNTVCKISSEYCEAKSWSPVLQFLIQHFGPKRLLYGSNWPVCTPTVDLVRATSQLTQLTGNHGQDIMEGNARRVYCAAPAIEAKSTGEI